MYLHLFRQGASRLKHVAGSLGLVEVWVFIVYVLGKAAHFTSFEAVSFGEQVSFRARCGSSMQEMSTTAV